MKSQSSSMAYNLSTLKLLHKAVSSIFIILAALAWALPAGAHGVEVVKTDPPAGAVIDTPPERVTVWFSEELQTGESWLRIFDQSGKQVDMGDGGVDLTDAQHASMKVGLPAGLPEGAYEVRYKAMLLDGDASEGAYRYFVGSKGAAAATELATVPAAAQDTGGNKSLLTWSAAIVISVVLLGLIVFRVVSRKQV